MSKDYLTFEHPSLIRESVVNFKGNRVLIIHRSEKLMKVQDKDTGDILYISMFDSFDSLPREAGDYIIENSERLMSSVLIPGFIDKYREKIDGGKPTYRIKKLISEPDKKEIGKIVREYGYRGKILYFEPEDIF